LAIDDGDRRQALAGRPARYLAAGAFLLLFMWKTPPWPVVVLSAVGGAIIAAL